MNKKHLITAILLVVTVVMGGVGVYIGLNMPEEIEELPQTGNHPNVTCSCNSYSTFCGGEWCNYSGYSNTECQPNWTMTCNSVTGADCKRPIDACGCSCEGKWPDPKPGYETIPCGSYTGASNQYQEHYTTLCSGCNNPYFCVQCYEKEEVPVTTAVPPTTKPPKTTVPPTTPPKTTIPPTTTVIPTTKIPDTALISDEVDSIVVGIGLLTIGLMFFSFNFHIKLGNFFWNIKEVKPINYIDEKTKKAFAEDREDFESKF